MRGHLPWPLTGTEVRMNALAIIDARELAESGRAAELRRAAGLSQADVADTCGVTEAAVSRWESGKRSPRGARARAYAQLLNELSRRFPVDA